MGLSQRSREESASSAATRSAKATPSAPREAPRAVPASRASWHATAAVPARAQPTTATTPARAQAPETVSSATCPVRAVMITPIPAASSATIPITAPRGASRGVHRPAPAPRMSSTRPSSSSARSVRQVMSTAIRAVHITR